MLQIIQKLIEGIQKQIKEIKAFSWQTLILLSLFSWLVSLAIETEILEEIVARMGWIFLTIGVSWALEKVKYEKIFGGITFYPGPWIAGALICVFVFQDLPGGRYLNWTLWPLVSVAIALAPKFFKHGKSLVDPFFPNPKKLASDRQLLVLLVLLGIILSCWFQFHFLVEEWLTQYPSLRADTFEQSSFVVKVQRPTASRGKIMLELIESILQQKFSALSWAGAQQWLARLDEQQVDSLEKEVMQQLSSPENPLWHLEAEVLPNEPEYTVRFRTFWRGPTSQPPGYFEEKICQITEAAIPGTTAVACNPEIQRFPIIR